MNPNFIHAIEVLNIEKSKYLKKLHEIKFNVGDLFDKTEHNHDYLILDNLQKAIDKLSE